MRCRGPQSDFEVSVDFLMPAASVPALVCDFSELGQGHYPLVNCHRLRELQRSGYRNL